MKRFLNKFRVRLDELHRILARQNWQAALGSKYPDFFTRPLSSFHFVPYCLGERLYALSLETQATISSAGVLMDVRTPVFGDTSLEEMVRLGADVARSNPETTFWTWRLYKPVHGCEWSAPQLETVLEMLARVSSMYPRHWMGIRAKWEKGGMVYFLGGQRVNHGEGEDVQEERGSGNGFTYAVKAA